MQGALCAAGLSGYNTINSAARATPSLAITCTCDPSNTRTPTTELMDVQRSERSNHHLVDLAMYASSERGSSLPIASVRAARP